MPGRLGHWLDDWGGMIFLSGIFALLAVMGAVQVLLAARAAIRLAGAEPARGPAQPAAILKPLHGATPRLRNNLAATLAQRHAAPFEMLVALADPQDPARKIAEGFCPPAQLLLGGVVLGANRKVSQLVHLAGATDAPVLVLADADMAVDPDWLTAVTAPLAEPGVGLVTCLYRGVAADDGVWSRLTALSVDWHFLPNAALGEALGQAQGCYGATIALRAETLAAIGGFAAFLELLADDHAMGAAVRALGLRVVLAPVLPGHVMAERGFAGLWAHELRWARTVRMLNPAGYAGLALTHPIAWAAFSLLAAPGALSAAVLGLALAARFAACARVDRALGVSPRPAWVVPRDLLSFAIWLAGLWPGRVRWGAERFHVARDGRMRRQA
jgi:ceramide glucosyltransferase